MFLNKLNIVNVSISRARDYLFVLILDDETENVGNLTLIKNVEQICKEQPEWSELLSPVIEEAMFGSRTYLEDNSFSTSHQLVNVYGSKSGMKSVARTMSWTYRFTNRTYISRNARERLKIRYSRAFGVLSIRAVYISINPYKLPL